MKKFGYKAVKFWIKTCLYLYYGKIQVSGLENVPKNIPVLFLPNHQSALLDVLLIVVDCSRKPWFLTRSDIFKKKTLIAIFEFFQMIPIYRIRDGRESLKNNQAIFDRCSDLLRDNEAIVMFPEANHNLKRRVRPLSKGFTRILFNTLQQAPDTDIRIVPVGLNYEEAVHFPDKVALLFGKNIPVMDLFDSADERASVDRIKQVVSDSLKTLTTHIENEDTYEATIAKLDATGVDYLKPNEVNAQLGNLAEIDERKDNKIARYASKIFKLLFAVLNLPLVLIWRIFVKPKVWEPEFMGTLRFGFALVAYPIFYILLFTLISWITGPAIALISVLGVFLFNWAFVKLG